MNKILICSNHLGSGGIETTLINLIKMYDFKDFKITLLLMNKKGHLLKDLPKNIEVIDFNYCRNKNRIIKKIINTIKYKVYILKLYNRYNYSICFSPHIKEAARIAYYSSPKGKRILWCHSNYPLFFNYDNKRIKKFIRHNKMMKYDKIVFVSENGLNDMIKLLSHIKERSIYIPNFINKEVMEEKSTKKINVNIKNKFVFLNISRHEEKTKKISRIINAAYLLKKNNYKKFVILLVGSGIDTINYKKQVEELNLNDTVIFVGEKSNPYPYYKIADCFLITSDLEGGPITFYEALNFNVPIITTNVGDVNLYSEIYNVRIIEKNEFDLYKKMLDVLNNKQFTYKRFDVNKYNDEIIKKIAYLFWGDNRDENKYI